MFKKKRVYLDSAAGVSANASSPHREGHLVSLTLGDARTKIARLIEVKPDDVIFTGGATEANALAILGATRAFRASEGKQPHLLYFAGSHSSIVENMRLAEREGALIEELPTVNCKVDTDTLAKMLRPETLLISLEAVCGETGVVWNTREVAQVLLTHGQTRSGQWLSRPGLSNGRALLHVDASQAVWTEKLTRAHFGADLMTLDASKVCVARGIGCLIASRVIPLAPLYAGGGQERGLWPGSEAPALASAFAEGLARAAEGREAFRAEAASARATLVTVIRKGLPAQAGIPTVLVNEAPSLAAQAPHILNLSFPGYDTDYLLALLDEAGFAVSTKSACETASDEGSRAVLALFNDHIRAASTLRISWGSQVKGRDLQRFARALIDACAFIDSTRSK